jgi:hypothetical protein
MAVNAHFASFRDQLKKSVGSLVRTFRKPVRTKCGALKNMYSKSTRWLRVIGVLQTCKQTKEWAAGDTLQNLGAGCCRLSCRELGTSNGGRRKEAVARSGWACLGSV